MSEAPLVVALNGQIDPTHPGGTESSVMSVVEHLAPRRDELVLKFISLPRLVDVCKAHAPGCDIIPWPLPMSMPIDDVVRGARWVALRSSLGPAKRVFDRAVWTYRRIRAMKRLPSAADCDALLSQHNVDVVHFGWSAVFPTRRPFIYEPHDLQHRHYPENFPPKLVRWREEMYGNACRRAHRIVCGTWWTKEDIIRQYGVPSRNVAVIPRSSVKARKPVSLEREAEIVREFDLAQDFACYSAMTFAHKNHLRLVEAVRRLRDERGIRINVVFTGRKLEPMHSQIMEAVEAAGLQGQVRMLGPVPEDVLTVIYKRASFMVFPSLFEGLSQSLLEALGAGLPVVAARQSSVPETVGAAGLFFDGEDTQSMVDCLASAICDRAQLNRLAAATKAEMRRYDWERAAKTFIAVYRSAAGRKLNSEQSVLLEHATGPAP